CRIVKGMLSAMPITLYPAKLSRPRCNWVTSGDFASTEATKRPKAGMSKKNGSSTKPAKNDTPVAGSVVTTCVGAVAAVEERVVGAEKVCLPGNTMVAVCGPPEPSTGENLTLTNWSGFASPVVSNLN